MYTELIRTQNYTFPPATKQSNIYLHNYPRKYYLVYFSPWVIPSLCHKLVTNTKWSSSFQLSDNDIINLIAGLTGNSETHMIIFFLAGVSQDLTINDIVLSLHVSIFDCFCLDRSPSIDISITLLALSAIWMSAASFGFYMH